MSGGQVHVPLVIRMATGAGRQLAAQHSHSLEGWYAHVPGLRVLAPATVAGRPGDAAARPCATPTPWWSSSTSASTGPRRSCPAGAGATDIDHAAIRRPGRDVSIVTHGGSLPKALDAAEQLEGRGIDAEVVDLRTLRPLDTETVLGSVTRTHRAVVVDEGWRTAGLSAEVAAGIAEEAFWDLDAPVGRVAAAEVPDPLRPPPRGGRPPAGPRHRRGRAGLRRRGCLRWASSGCRRSGRTWSPEPSPSGASHRATGCTEATSWPWSTPRSPTSRSRSSRTASSRSCWSVRAGRCPSARRWRAWPRRWPSPSPRHRPRRWSEPRSTRRPLPRGRRRSLPPGSIAGAGCGRRPGPVAEPRPRAWTSPW